MSKNILRQTAGYADRVNPDYAKNVQAAKAEEHILALLMLYEEHRKNTFGNNLLTSGDFATDFGRRVFEKISELESLGQFSESSMGEFFSLDEMSRLKKIQLDRISLTNNSAEVFFDCVKSLKEENASGQESSGGEEDILSVISRKKQKIKK